MDITLNMRSRQGGCAFIRLVGCLVVLLAMAGSAYCEEATSEPSDTAQRLLVVRPQMQGTGRPTTAALALLLKDGKCLQSKTATQDRPILFVDPPSGKLRVVLATWPSQLGNDDPPPTYLAGEVDVTIGTEQRTVVDLPVRVAEMTACSLAIGDADGKPLASHTARIGDAGACKVDLAASIDTDSQGRARVAMVPDRSYVLLTQSYVAGFRFEHTLPIEPATLVDGKLAWSLTLPPTLEIVFWIAEGDKKRICEEIERITIEGEGKPRNIFVKGGRSLLGKADPRLAGKKVFQIVDLSSSESLDVEVVEGAEVRIDDTTRQRVDIVVRRREYGAFKIALEAGKDVQASAVYAICAPSLNRAVASGPEFRRLRPGKYTVFAWSPNHGIAEKEVSVVAGKMPSIAMQLPEPTTLSGRVVNSAGQAVSDALIEVFYEGLPDQMWERVSANKAGEFTVTWDPHRSRQMRVHAREYGSVVKRIKGGEAGSEFVKVSFDKPIQVSGTAQIEGIDTSEKRWRNQTSPALFWVSKEELPVVVARAFLVDGKYRASLQAGNYDVYCFYGGDACLIDSVDLVQAKGDYKAKDITITAKDWDLQKRSWNTLGIRWLWGNQAW